MKTRELKDVKVGMFIFEEKARLMAKVSAVSATGFKFLVLNGLWDGSVRNGQSVIHTGKKDLTDQSWTFREVLAVTEEEYDQWYMSNGRGAARLISPDAIAMPDEDPQGPDLDAEIPFEDNLPVFEAIFVFKVVGEEQTHEAFLDWMNSKSLRDLAEQAHSGELIGQSRLMGTREVPPGQVAHVLHEMGNDGSFIEAISQADPRADDASHLIEILKADQGWDENSVASLAEAFIREQGLAHLYAEHLKKQATLENDAGSDFTY